MAGSRPQQSLLVLHQGALGDFIVTFPVLAALRTVFARIAGVCRIDFGRLALHLGLLDAAHPLEAAMFASLYTDSVDPRVRRLLLAHDRVLLFSFSETLQKAAAAVNSNAVCRIDPWPPPDRCDSVHRFLADGVARCGWLGKEDRLLLRRFIGAPPALPVRRLLPGAPILLAPGAGGVKKRWPLEQFLTVYQALERDGLRPEILLGPVETDLDAKLRQNGAAVRRIRKPADLIELAALLKTAAGYIGNDSGVGHLAGYLGVASVILFGSTDRAAWVPWGPRVRAVRPPGGGAGDECSGLQCITPETVLPAFYDMVSGG
jgi:heptosyltransferase-3